jgi:hypothetical protein
VKKGVQQALRDRSNLGWVGLASLPPQNAAPFKSQPLNRSYDVIVGGGHAAQQAAASELQAAIVGAAVQAGATAAPVIVTNPANSVTQSTPASFLTLNPQAYERMHVSGVECAASSLDAYSNLLFTVQLDGLTVLDHVPLDALAELSLDVKPLGQLAFSRHELGRGRRLPRPLHAQGLALPGPRPRRLRERGPLPGRPRRPRSRRRGSGL